MVLSFLNIIMCLFRYEVGDFYWKLKGPGHAKTYLKPYANNKGADQPAHPRSLISTSVVRCLDNICILAISKVSRF